MTDFRTHGYDIVVEASEDVVDRFLGGSLAGLLSDCGGEFDEAGLAGRCSFLDPADASGAISLDTAIADGVNLDIPFHLTADFDDSPGWPDAGGFTGRIRVTARLMVGEFLENIACVSVDFRDLEPSRVSVVHLDALEPGWPPHEAALRSFIEDRVLRGLVDREQFDSALIIPFDPSNDGSEPFTPTSVDLRVLGDGAIRSVAVLIPTSPVTEGNRDAFAESVLDPGEEIVCILGNEILLRRIVGWSLLEAFELLDPAAPDPLADLHAMLSFEGTRASLTAPVDVEHLIDEWWAQAASLSNLTIDVTDDERIEVSVEILAGGVFVETRTLLHMSATIEPASGNRAILHWHIDEPDVTIVPGPLSWVLVGALAAIIFALKGVATRFVFGVFENFLAGECTLVGLEEWPEEPQAVDVDCSVDIPWPIPLVLDDIVLDDWAAIGRATVVEPAYEWPSPTLQILGDWQATDGEFVSIRSGAAPRGVFHEILTYQQAHDGAFRALTSGLAHPIDFAWCLGGHNLLGEGQVTVGETTLGYSVDGDRCTLALEQGESLESELCVTALDARGTELFTRREIAVQGEETFHNFIGVEKLEGPIPELFQPALAARFPSPAETMLVDDYNVMVGSAFVRGMGVDPTYPTVRRPGR